MPRARRYFAVVWIKDDEVAYVGPYAGRAARRLKKGTVHGESTSPRGAIRAARRLAERMRANERLPQPEWVNKHSRPRRKPGDPSRRRIKRVAKIVRDVGFEDPRYGWSPPWEGYRYVPPQNT